MNMTKQEIELTYIKKLICKKANSFESEIKSLASDSTTIDKNNAIIVQFLSRYSKETPQFQLFYKKLNKSNRKFIDGILAPMDMKFQEYPALYKAITTSENMDKADYQSLKQRSLLDWKLAVHDAQENAIWQASIQNNTKDLANLDVTRIRFEFEDFVSYMQKTGLASHGKYVITNSILIGLESALIVALMLPDVITWYSVAVLMAGSIFNMFIQGIAEIVWGRCDYHSSIKFDRMTLEDLRYLLSKDTAMSHILARLAREDLQLAKQIAYFINTEGLAARSWLVNAMKNVDNIKYEGPNQEETAILDKVLSTEEFEPEIKILFENRPSINIKTCSANNER